MASTLSEWFHAALDFIFPAECSYCHRFLGDDRIVIFCRTCWETISDINENESVCSRCGRTFLSPVGLRKTSQFVCGACRITPPFFDRACIATVYENVVKAAIHQFKFSQKIGLGSPLAQLLISALPDDINRGMYHAVLPVPLHPRRQRQRGYNQSAILAKYLARHLHVPLILNNLRRIRPTDEQALLKGQKARHENVKNAFQLEEPATLCEKNVILVDDVMSTGATVNECAKTLKQAGVKLVCVVVLSRPALPSATRSLSATDS